MLEPLFSGDWAPFGETLCHSPVAPVRAVCVGDLVRHPARLEALLRHHARHLGVTGRDLRAAASTWSLRYLWALLVPVAAGASVLQHVFPVGTDQIAVEVCPNGEPIRFHIAHEGIAAAEASTWERYALLLRGHLAPLFEAISERTRLPQKILWGNAARYLDTFFEHALQHAGAGAMLRTDRHVLLEQPIWPDGRTNPLSVRQASDPALHPQCCLQYRLPGEDYCTSCPLSEARRRVNRPAPGIPPAH